MTGLATRLHDKGYALDDFLQLGGELAVWFLDSRPARI